MSDFSISGRPVGQDENTFVIAEAGSNHNGDFETAERLIEAAADAGADAVKFQTFRADRLYADDRDTSGDSAYETVQPLEQPYEWIPDLHETCRENDIVFMSTPFDAESLSRLEAYIPAVKIASMTLSHVPFLREVAATGLPVIMSTGAHERGEVASAVETLREAGVSELCLLHCVSSYPTPLSESNLRAIETLGSEFETPTGLSDHTVEPTVAPTASVAMGASVVEKHFTLDNDMPGPDHSFALEPDELSEMIDAIRRTESALGSGRIETADCETRSCDRARRSLFANRDIDSGERLGREDLNVLRPGDNDRGIDALEYDSVVGSVTTESVASGDPITPENIEMCNRDDDSC